MHDMVCLLAQIRMDSVMVLGFSCSYDLSEGARGNGTWDFMFVGNGGEKDGE